MKFSHLKSLSPEALLTQLHDAVKRERESTTAVLYHIQEIERRKLHLEKGYDSLHTFLVEVERYSKGAAHRRIKAMQLLKAIPEVEERLESGALNLTTATVAQSYFEKKKVVSQDAKREVLGKIEGKSKE